MHQGYGTTATAHTHTQWADDQPITHTHNSLIHYQTFILSNAVHSNCYLVFHRQFITILPLIGPRCRFLLLLSGHLVHLWSVLSLHIISSLSVIRASMKTLTASFMPQNFRDLVLKRLTSSSCSFRCFSASSCWIWANDNPALLVWAADLPRPPHADSVCATHHFCSIQLLDLIARPKERKKLAIAI